MGQVIHKLLKVDDMTCISCERKIDKKLGSLDGVIEVEASYEKSTVKIKYDEEIIKIYEIAEEIEQLGYSVKDIANTDNNTSDRENKFSATQLLGIGIIIYSIYLIIKNTVGFNFIPQVSQDMGYGILFIVGLLTSLHCIAMCGGINLSQCVGYNSSTESKFSSMKPSILYNLGRVISYTLIGGIVGIIGSVVNFSGGAKGAVAIFAGVFMLIMGVNMLNIFPWLKKLNPRMPKIFANKINKNTDKGPLYVGMLNGLMPCGPLQAMQLYALGTGSFTAGALSMFVFSIGTVPLMFGFGAISTLLSGKFTQKMMKVSAVLVMVLGVIMVSRGLNLSGVNLGFALAAPQISDGSVAKVEGNIQYVSTKLESGNYSPIIVQKGIPVKWTITASQDDLNGCNNPITIPKYDKQYKLVPGDNIIEFTPKETGNITYTCWMGMISSTIRVVDDINKITEKDLEKANKTGLLGRLNSGGSCCSAGSKATRFYGGKIPTDDITIAKIENNIQEVTIKVNDEGFSPAAVVLQKGIKTKIKFDNEQLNYCNNIIVFPEYGEQLNLENGDLETPYFTPKQDFTFRCWMGMLNGYVKVVDDINNVDIDEIKVQIENYRPASGSGGCCGG